MTDFESTDISEIDRAQGGYPGQLTLDVQKYRHHVNQFDITEAQKIALLQTLWDIMRRFVELGYGVDSVHRFIPAWNDFSSVEDSNDVEQSIPTSQFNSAATENAAKEEES